MNTMQYSLVTQWRLDAPMERVWDVLIATEDWPHWWRYVKQVVEIEKGNAQGLDSGSTIDMDEQAALSTIF